MSIRAGFIAKTLLQVAIATVILVIGLVYYTSRVSKPKHDARTMSKATWQQELELLRSLPYVSVVPAERRNGVGVTLFDQARTQPGYNLYCSRITNEVFLEDLQGRAIKKWTFPEGNPSPEELARRIKGVTATAILVGDGRLLALRKNKDLTLFSWEGEILWQKKIKGHHDLVSPGDGTAFVILGRRENYRDVFIDCPVIAQLDVEDGSILDQWSACDHLATIREKLGESWMLDRLLDYRDAALAANDTEALAATESKRKFGLRLKNGKNVDLFHTNTISLIPLNPLGEKDPRFRPGGLLLCFRNLNTIAILDWAQKKLVWLWGPGVLQRPHFPTMLENGHILVFDNGTQRKYSRVLEVDPSTGEILWRYHAAIKSEFFSPTKGSAQRLANGNTLICNADHGHVFEVAQDGEVVWEWWSPIVEDRSFLRPFQRASEPPYRTVIYRMLRIPPESLHAEQVLTYDQ